MVREVDSTVKSQKQINYILSRTGAVRSRMGPEGFLFPIEGFGQQMGLLSRVTKRAGSPGDGDEG